MKKGDQIGVRVTEALRAFLQKQGARQGMKEGAFARFGMETFKDLYEGLGEDFWTVMGKANTSEEPIGTVLARLVRAGLDRDGKPRRGQG